MSDDEHTAWLGELLREQFAPPVQDWTGPVDGPTARQMRADRVAEILAALDTDQLKAGHALYVEYWSRGDVAPYVVLDWEAAYRKRATRQRRDARGSEEGVG